MSADVGGLVSSSRCIARTIAATCGNRFVRTRLLGTTAERRSSKFPPGEIRRRIFSGGEKTRAKRVSPPTSYRRYLGKTSLASLIITQPFASRFRANDRSKYGSRLGADRLMCRHCVDKIDVYFCPVTRRHRRRRGCSN